MLNILGTLKAQGKGREGRESHPGTRYLKGKILLVLDKLGGSRCSKVGEKGSCVVRLAVGDCVKGGFGAWKGR